MHPLSQALFIALAVALALPSIAQTAASTPVAKVAARDGLRWSQLTEEQMTALSPLEDLWPGLSAEHRRKWLALAQNFNRLPPSEQETLQGRMTEWADLSPTQRTRVRLNFGEVRKVPSDEKRAKWEEYQTLPAEERERLATGRPKPPVGAAPALRPAPPSKMARPSRTPSRTPEATLTRAVQPAATVNRNTLLPQAPASGARK